MKKSMLDVAYEIICEKNEPIGFAELLAEIGNRLGVEESYLLKKASNFYTDLLRDGRFVTLGENTWDLRTNHKFDKVHIDMNDIYHEDEIEREDIKDKTIESNTDLYDVLLEGDEISKDEEEDEEEDVIVVEEEEEETNPGFTIKTAEEIEKGE